MNVVLTCACGRSQPVAITLAGKQTTCVACGKAINVPAMGIAEAPKRVAGVPQSPFALPSSAPAQHKAAQGLSSRWMTAILLAACGLLLLLTLVVGAFALGLHTKLLDLIPVAQAPPAAPNENIPAPKEPTPNESPNEPESSDRPVTPINLKPAEVIVPPPGATIAKPFDVGPVTIAKPAGDMAPVVAVKPVPAEGRRPFAAGDTFLQDLLVTQKSRFAVQGIPVATLLQYRIASRYMVQKVHEDGSMTVQQKIEAATLLQADDVTQGLLAGPVTQMPGTTFQLEISPRGEVTKFGGAGGAMQFGAAKLPGGLGVQMASLLDADGWKEMAQATFFQPEVLDKPGKWNRPMTHNWGPLGGWAGQVAYAYPGPDKGPEVKVGYTLKVAYVQPKGGGAPGALPLQIKGANFLPPQAAGQILFHTERSRTAAAEERFYVRGTLVIMLLGQNTPCEIEEEQVFKLRIVEKPLP